jgi:asparagine synthase (glutamine-hydrolysing)
MCGIFGYNSKKDHSQAFFASLSHRGPDNSSLERHGEWSLGHLRLSIIDTSDSANQPMEKDGNAIIFNGEIYNYLELKKKYLSGVPLQTVSDTEVLLELLNRRGLGILHELNGMFAFAWYRSAERELVLCRDRFGVKPLYWAAYEGSFLFSSEVRPLIRVTGRRSFDYSVVKTFITDTATDYGDSCFIAGIRQVPAGHMLSFKDGKARVTQWYAWSDFAFDEAVFADHRKTVDTFEELLSDAIALRHRSDVPLCLTLSGGLDSTVIYTLAKEKLSSHAVPFTFSHPGADTDELARASRLAAEYGDKPVVVESSHQTGKDDVLEALRHLEFPMWNLSAVAYLDMYKAIKKHGFTVVLEGHGSDEQLGGYPYMLEAIWRNAVANLRFGFSKEVLDAWKSSLHAGLGQREPRRIPSEVFLFGKGILNSLRKGVNMFSSRAVLDDAFRYKILPIVLRTFDRLPMSQSLESRAPFMDFRVAEFVRKLPYAYKANRLGSKAILREILRKYGKEYIYTNKAKMGFASDVPGFFRAPENRLFMEAHVRASSVPNSLKKRAQEKFEKDSIGWNDVEPVWKAASLHIMEEIYAHI